jgi:hypothetical protein
MKEPQDIEECIGKALDLLSDWIRTSVYPAPEVRRSVSVFDDGDQLIRLEVPELTLSAEDVDAFLGLIKKSPLLGRVVLIRGYLSAISGRLNVISSRKAGTRFDIFIPGLDPVKEFVMARTICQKLVSFDFSIKEFFGIWKWTRAESKRIKRRHAIGFPAPSESHTRNFS